MARKSIKQKKAEQNLALGVFFWMLGLGMCWLLIVVISFRAHYVMGFLTLAASFCGLGLAMIRHYQRQKKS